MADRINLEQYGVSPSRGFLPDRPPELSFRDTRFAAWDKITKQLPELISSQRLKQEIATLPMLDAELLISDQDQQRAFVVLAFLVHAHVWTGQDGRPNEVVPRQLAKPFVTICRILEMEPVLSYAGLCLWNWTTSSTARDQVPELDELQAVASFTGTRGEDAFYHVPVLIESEGGKAIPLLLDAINAGQSGDLPAVTDSLLKCTDTIIRMKQHLPKMYSNLDADFFFSTLRRFFAAGKGMEEKGLPRGFVFDLGDGVEQEAKYVGGSAAQSSLFQFMDIALGVEHAAPESGAPSLFKEMQSYMPRKHRDFLAKFSELPSIRTVVERNPRDESLRNAYEDCLKQLRSWRASHIAIVSKYVVRPARLASAGSEAAAAAFENEEGEGLKLKGTAGSALIPFLKQTKEDTKGLA